MVIKKKMGKKESENNIEELLIENFVALQSAFSKMAQKMDNLTGNISRLLDLFEKSAKEFVGNQGTLTKEDKEFIEKLDKLIDQNKVIAKGLTLMDERIRDKVGGDFKSDKKDKKENDITLPEKSEKDRLKDLENKIKPKLLPSI